MIYIVGASSILQQIGFIVKNDSVKWLASPVVVNNIFLVSWVCVCIQSMCNQVTFM